MSRMITALGFTAGPSAWQRVTGVDRRQLVRRVFDYGWDPDEAVLTSSGGSKSDRASDREELKTAIAEEPTSIELLELDPTKCEPGQTVYFASGATGELVDIDEGDENMPFFVQVDGTGWWFYANGSYDSNVSQLTDQGDKYKRIVRIA